MKFVSGDGVEDLKIKAGRALSELISVNQPVLFMLSGGSALSVLDFVQVLNPKLVTVMMTDDRWSTDSAVNNFSQLMKTDFYPKLLSDGATFLDSRVIGDESLEFFALRFEKMLRGWIARHETGKIVGLFGMGADGHTCGIMPFPEDSKFFEEYFCGEKIVQGYNAGAKNQYPLRVTVTCSFLMKYISSGVLFFYGAEKKRAAEHLMSVEGSLSETPARALRGLNVSVITERGLEEGNR